ncbi:hypothetical protein AK88_05256 [Plasmodium fragile]|uniref:Schizont-infected cell agglutination C-terminal domain-containing protein n=1 Tax=Plasmodium fragile TaxID=5857 RepID=A0A0D9QE94_PLAFR|nr:uncharacterized protein AK88_05256 [Plasmodium fragile]KJP85117.1 hypothetical protein AK88_05256 [Plasmodium fragile]
MAEKLVEVLVEYVQQRQIASDKGEGQARKSEFSDMLWDDIEKLFTELTATLRVKTTIENAVCQALYGKAKESVVQRLICRYIVKIFVYMDGTAEVVTGGTKLNAEQKSWRDYFKCVVGNVTLIKLFEKNCAAKDIINKVSRHMSTISKALAGHTNSQQCQGLDYDSLSIGTKFVAGTMGEWINRWRLTSVGGLGGSRAQTSCAAPTSITKARAKTDSEDAHVVKLFQDGTAREVAGLIHKEAKITESQRRRIMQAAKDKGTATSVLDEVMRQIETKHHGDGGNIQVPDPSASIHATGTQPQGPKGKPSAGRELGDPAGGRSLPPSQPQAPASAVLPARPQAPPPPSPPQDPTTQGGKETHSTDRCSKPAQSATVVNAGEGLAGAKSITTITFGTSSGTHDDCDQKSKDTEAGLSAPTNTESTEQTVPQAAAGPPSSGPTSTSTQTPSTEATRAATPAGPPGPTATAGEADSSGQDAVVDGGNDDPPPLNPPKPKPHPNPEQSGSSSPSGPTSTGRAPDGQSTRSYERGGGGAVAPGSPPGSQDIASPGGGDPSASLPPGGAQDPNHGEIPAVVTQSGSGHVPGGGVSNTPGGPTQKPNDAPPLVPLLRSKPFDPKDLIPYTPALLPAVVGTAIIAFFLWKYFAYLAKRRRTYRTVRDVPSPPLDEDILEHLQRGDLPPPDYDYTMVRDRQPASTSARRRRSPRVHTRTIIELHLEVLHECEATEWENAKDDYLQIVVEQFAQEFAQDLMRDQETNNNIVGVSTADHGLLGNHVPSTLDPPIDSDGHDPCPPHDPDPWSCMETIQFARERAPPNADDPDPWSCMEPVQLATDTSPPDEEDPDPWRCMETIHPEKQQRNVHSHPGDAPSDCTQCIPWIDRNKHLLQDCTTQQWFLQLKLEWTQYLRQHAPNDDNVHRELSEQRSIGCVEMKKDAWKQWVVKQHNDMAKYIEKDWFRHLLNTVQEETVPAKGDVPAVDTDLNMQIVTAAADILSVRDIPRTQPLHPQPYMTKPLTAQLWMLLLAFVIEQCELESRLQEKELYVDDLLAKI